MFSVGCSWETGPRQAKVVWDALVSLRCGLEEPRKCSGKLDTRKIQIDRHCGRYVILLLSFLVASSSDYSLKTPRPRTMQPILCVSHWGAVSWQVLAQSGDVHRHEEGIFEGFGTWWGLLLGLLTRTNVWCLRFLARILKIGPIGPYRKSWNRFRFGVQGGLLVHFEQWCNKTEKTISSMHIFLLRIHS